MLNLLLRRCVLRAVWLSVAFWPVAQAPVVAAPAEAAPVPVQTVPDEVALAMRVGDFAALERLYARYGQRGVVSELTGTPRVGHFWNGISQISKYSLRVTDAYFIQLDALTAQWVERNPRVLLAHLLHADALNTHAWAYRGGGFAKSVPAAAWSQFEKYNERAYQVLRRAEPLAAEDSSWNFLMLRVGRAMGWSVDRSWAVFENGVGKNPNHDGLYEEMLNSVLPKWGGDLRLVDRVIAHAVKSTRAERGLALYASLYGMVSYAELEQSLFTASLASWPSMRTGFEDLIKRYPHSDHRNKFAYFACMANDRETLRVQLALMEGAFEPRFWGDHPERTYDGCRALAGNA